MVFSNSFIAYFVLVHVSVLLICFPVCYNDKNPEKPLQYRVAASGFGICTDCWRDKTGNYDWKFASWK